MVSVLTPAAMAPLNTPEPCFNEVSRLQDAVEPFSRPVGTEHAAIHLHCTIPTWSHSSSNCLDLHDLHELRSRLLVFIHDLIQKLRASGIHTTYSLTPSDTSLCVVCALPPGLNSSQAKMTVSDLVRQSGPIQQKHVILADLQKAPCLIIS
uniref:Putative poxc laccase transcription factor n=1 Tax=Pleurotus ostreatus TaxID=5322 RepID=A0A089X4E0_PLEOS|nr:putative poxc laccase transcription factor [Pleurotus ostreatus]